MYTQSEKLALINVNLLNKLIQLSNDNETIIKYNIDKIIRESIDDIESVGGKIRPIEDGLLTLIELNEKKCFSRL
tara:strand:+ start:87 stop:311 length:225 start_codon:yes stop_codon:yes gene_type:complete